MTSLLMLRTHALRLLWPATVLMMLLQRAPMLRVLVSADFSPGATRMGQMLRAAFPAFAGVLAVNTLTGATRFTANPVSPASATQGTAFATVFSVTGAPSTPKSYTVSGLPAGLTVPAGTLNGTTWTVNSSTGSISGTPTASGNFTVNIRAYANNNGGGDKSPIYNYVINVTGSANAPPAFTTHPASQTVTAGGSASFSVAASGTPTPTFQWRKGGANLAGKTAATLSFTAVSAADAGSYECVATNTAGSATSTAATLTVTVAPAFTTQPTTQSVTAGGTASFTVAVTGTPTPTLQWRKGGANLAGRISATLSLTSVSAGDAGNYDCVATNTAGATTSTAAALTVNAATVAPAFTTQPVAQIVTAGGSVSFTVAASGTPTPTLQWRKGGANLAGQTSATLSLTSVSAGDAGNYDCVATNSAGSATSSVAALTVNAATVLPAFTTPPVAQTVTAGGSVSFTVAASGTPTPTLQWRKGGADLAGQTTATLTLANVSAGDAGNYDCVAANAAGSVTSASATLTVNSADTAPTFTLHPVSQSASGGATVAFTVAASGVPTPALQWRKGAANLAGQTGVTLTLSNVGAGDAGSYDCVATNSVGSATSTAGTLTVAAAAPPAITVQPVPMTSLAGGSAFFAAQATGSGLTYQWFKNAVPIPGASQSSLSLSSVQAGDAGTYTVVVTDAFGVQAASTTANLAVVASGSACLVNMSARAGVGVGADALIPGFVIQGDVALTLLVRGVGPQLGVYGVPGILEDPVMSLFQGPSLLATNDDWEQSPDLAALNAATTTTGAFPLAAGGKDCAMLLTLNPGVYTVQVTGKNGVTGVALVELYVVGP